MTTIFWYEWDDYDNTRRSGRMNMAGHKYARIIIPNYDDCVEHFVKNNRKDALVIE